MTITTPAVPTRTAATRPYRRNSLVAGVLYVLTFAASIPAVLLLSPVLNDPAYIVGAGSDTRVLAGCLLDVITALAGIGTAVALFPVVKRQNEGVALGFVTSRMLEGAVIMIGVVSLLAVVTLRQTVGGTAGIESPALVAVGQGLVAVRNWTFLLGPGLMAGVNALLLGSLLYRSRLVPRIIPTLGLIGAPLLLVATLLTFFGYTSQLSLVSGIATAPIFVWELSVGFWMAIKGFTPSAITDRV
jgi:Domain of unknown function (DUF4386)